MHAYHANTGLPVATILRPAKTRGGREVATAVAVAATTGDPGDDASAAESGEASPPCPCCGGPMTIIEFLPGPGRRQLPRRDTS